MTRDMRLNVGNPRGRLEDMVALLPTPVATLGRGARNITSNSKRTPEALARSGPTLGDIAHLGAWGTYSVAINRWGRVLGRDAPDPTEPSGKEGRVRLTTGFVEWMMGLPEGWVTDVDISRNEQLKALGNGVVPQQCSAALRDMLAHIAFNEVTTAKAA